MCARYFCIITLLFAPLFGAKQTKPEQIKQVTQEIKELRSQKANKVSITIWYQNGKKLSVEMDPVEFIECLMAAGCTDDDMFY